HLVLHGLFKAPLFFAAGRAHEVTDSFDLRRMQLGRAVPWAALASLPAGLALAGLPPLGGGWSKEKIVAALGHVSPALAILAILAGALSAAYATRFLVMAFWPGAGRETARAQGVTGAIAGLSLLSALAGALFIPGIAAETAAMLGADLPKGTLTETMAALAALAFGALAGLWLARNPQPLSGAEWFGLPVLIARGIEAPVLALAAQLARIDDAWIDGPVRGAARIGPGLGRILARADDRLLDGEAAYGAGGSVRRAYWLIYRSFWQSFWQSGWQEEARQASFLYRSP
ncbi:hypothetical protein LCGC14_2476180, partial [marine sediment metagenome]